jgi:hypothetical protein
MTTYKPIPITDGGTEFRGSRSTIPEESLAEALAMIEAGSSRAEAARHIGISAGQMSRIAAANGLGFSESKTERANRVRLLNLQARRLDQAEQLHLTLDAAVALVQGQIITEPGQARAVAERARAVRDLASAYRDLVAIDAQALADAAGLEDAYRFLDQMTIAIRQPTEEGASHDRPE